MSKLNVEAVCMCDNLIYFSAYHKNGLYCYDRILKKCKFIMMFPNEESYAFRLHSRAVKIGDKIVFVPDKASHLHIYDIRTGDMNCISNSIFEINRYFAVSETEKVVYLFPRDMRTGIVALSKCDYSIRKICVDRLVEDDILASEYVENDGILYFACWTGSKIFTFDKYSELQKVIQIDGGYLGFSSIVISGDNIWLTSYNKIIKCTMNNESIHVDNELNIATKGFYKQNKDLVFFEDSSEYIKRRLYPIQIGYMLPGGIKYFARNSCTDLYVDTKCNTVCELETSGETLSERSQELLFDFHYLGHTEKGLLVTSLSSGSTYIYNGENVEELLLYDNDMEDKLIRNGEGTVRECNADSLRDFIGFIS